MKKKVVVMRLVGDGNLGWFVGSWTTLDPVVELASSWSSIPWYYFRMSRLTNDTLDSIDYLI